MLVAVYMGSGLVSLTVRCSHIENSQILLREVDRGVDKTATHVAFDVLVLETETVILAGLACKEIAVVFRGCHVRDGVLQSTENCVRTKSLGF